jgi:TusA-related sulfurtransferase
MEFAAHRSARFGDLLKVAGELEQLEPIWVSAFPACPAIPTGSSGESGWSMNCVKTSSKRRTAVDTAASPATALDIRNNSSPLSILKTLWALKQLGPGQLLEVLCSDDETKEDLLCIIRKSSNQEIIDISEEPDCWRLIILREGKGWVSDPRRSNYDG